MVNLDAEGKLITPDMARLLLNQLRVATHDEALSKSLCVGLSIPMSAAWENCGLVIRRSGTSLSSKTLCGLPVKELLDVEPNCFCVLDGDQAVARISNLALPVGN